MEKFFDIKCRYSGLVPQVVVLVATVRALKMHGGGPKVVAGKPLAPEYTDENLDLLRKGLPNMEQHIQNALKYGVNVVVAVNSFATDTPAEVELVRKAALEAGAMDAVVSTHWMDGGKGAVELAEAVVKAARTAQPLQVPLPAGSVHQGEDRNHLQGNLPRRWRRLLCPKPKKRSSCTPGSALTSCRSAWPKPTCPSPPIRTSRARPRGFRVPIRDIRASRRGRLPLSAAGQHAHHARPAHPPGLL